MKVKVFSKKLIACILALVISVVSCNVPEAFAANKNDNNGKDNKGKVQEVRERKERSDSKTDIIVKYKDDKSKSNTEKKAKDKTKENKFKQKRHLKEQKIVVYEISESDDLEVVIEELNEDPNVEYAQPNYPLEVAAIPTDDKLGYLWPLYNDGQVVDGYPGRATVDINVLTAWNLSMGSSDVVIGVLDTGIDIEHTDLVSNSYNNADEIPGNGIDDDGNGYIDDVNGWDFSNDDATVFDSVSTDTHGTYIAGIIAASADDGGVVGVAPNVKVMPLKFIHGSTGYTSDAIEAIEYAKNMGVKVINCSFGGADNNLALKEAMEDSGILFVCSAGNRGVDTADKPLYPAAFSIDNIISVAAIDSKGVLPTFSSYGSDVDIAAPGTSILGTTPGVDDDYSDNYDYYSGTSVSAAVVSGIAALVQSYLPNDTSLEIKDRILNGTVKSASLTDKVASGGRADAFAALTGTIQPFDDYSGEGNGGDVIPVEGDGETDTWYIMDEKARNAERFHYGEGGVNPASGNYSVTCTDMSVPAPGFQVNISRSYNSKDQRQTLLGQGWTFGFEGKITNKGDMLEVSLPNGGSHIFHLKNGAYIGEGTRAKLEKIADGSYILTTQDQYKYGFSAGASELNYMEDKNNNRILLSYTSGRLSKITDTVGRVYTLAYNDKSLLSSVTDPAGRKVIYEYNPNNLLTKVTDPQGGELQYQYDSSGYLTTLIDQNGHTFQQLVYSHNPGDSQNKVVKTIDAAGETWNYNYDMNNHNATITNSTGKKWNYWFDNAMYTIKVQDPEGRSTCTEYFNQNTDSYYGDVRANIDRNGNRTEYEVDLATGNVIKVTNPDGGIKSYLYDKWNNVIEEINEIGSRTFYIYDEQGKNLLKKAQPLNGTDNYVEGNTTTFAVTTYDYYSMSEANSQFNCNVTGLLKSETDPEGNTIIYTYNQYGDIASTKDAAGNVTKNTYDILGQKQSVITAEGNKTQYKYDKNGQIIKIINPDGGTQRTVYDAAGYKVLEVDPNLYDAAKENSTTGAYTGTSGTRYEWYDNGYQKALIDAEGNRTEYAWDIFGNKQTEKKPNGSIYRYEYDSMNRLIKTFFKGSSTSAEVLLNEISYSTLANGNTQTVTTVYASDDQKSTMTTIKDYAGREVQVQYGDNSRTFTEYNLNGSVKQKTAANGAITYCTYDALGNMTNVWKPLSVVEGRTMYSWTGYTYDKAGKMTSEMTGKSLVVLDATTDSVYTKHYTYEDGLLIQESDSEGRKTVYTYDGDGRAINVSKAITSTKEQTTELEYNFRGQPVSETTKVRAGDIAGNSYGDNGAVDIINSYSYDLNGNLVSSTDATGTITSYTYDKLNRTLSSTKQLKDSQGVLVADVSTSKTYTWDGKVATETDAKGNITQYEYDTQSNQTKITDTLGNITLKYYDRIGQMIAIVSPKNYNSDAELSDMEHTEFTYDALGRVLKQTEVYQKMSLNASFDWSKEGVNIITKTYKYDTLGNVIGITDALGNTKESTYNLAGLLEYVTDAETKAQGLPYTTKYTYNGLGQKIMETYPGADYTYTYDGVGNLLQTMINGVTKSITSYDYLGRAVNITDGRGNTTTQSWNLLGKVSQNNTPSDATIDSNKTIYQYDLLGNLVYAKDSMGKVTSYTYDSFGRNLSKTVRDEQGLSKITTSTEYDLSGNVLIQEDGNGNTTVSTYDEVNRLLTKTNALGQTTAYTYDANGNLLTETDYLGNTTTKVYDGINRLVEVRDAYEHVVQKLLYNDADAQISSFDALHNETKYLYDKNLRQAGTIDGEENTSTITYDVRGNISTETDGNGNTTTYKYDGENRLASVTDALGSSTLYTYDASGNLISQTDGNNNTTTYKYNAANLQTAKIDPEGNGDLAKTETYTYYPNGLMASKTDRNRVVTAYTYDVFGRLLSEDAGGEVQSYTYDANGNLLTMVDSTGTTVRTYDALNRNISKIVPIIGKSTYEYDLPVETTGEYAERTTDPKGNVTLNTYDKVRRLSKVTVGEDTTEYRYYVNGRRSMVTYPDGTKEVYNYDRNNQVKDLVNSKEDRTAISSYHYTYDAAGNQLTKVEEKGTTTYTYDNLNRLSSVSEPSGKVTSYTYDGAGNRKTEKVLYAMAEGSTIYTYNSQNRLISTSSTGGAYRKYIYDNNGNLVSKTSGIQEALKESLTVDDMSDFGLIIERDGGNGTGSKDIARYTYDNYNRLSCMKEDTTTALYKYNAQGYRVEKEVNGEATNYLYEVDKVVLETDRSNQQKAFQVYGSNLLYRNVAADAEMEAQSYYYLYNAHGDVTALIDVAGNIAATYDYDAFGTIINKSGDADNHITYAGYQQDDESGLYYLNARYYDSVTARFITEDDPKYSKRNDPLSLNLYVYCHNDPILYTDPSGHAGTSAYPCKMDDGRGFFAGLGFGILIISGYTVANGKITSSTSIKTEPFTGKSSSTVTVKQEITASDYPAAPTDQSKTTTSSTNKTKDKDASKEDSDTENQRGVGGKGWRGDKTWKGNVKEVGEGGTIKDLNGQVPTEQEAKDLIKESGGKVNRVEDAHDYPNPHNYHHINYTTASGAKGTIKIK